MAISYEEALATLQSMFSDQGYTSQQLDAVLRHHGGHMEHTVETLLSHGEGTPGELIDKLPSMPVGGGSIAATSADAMQHCIDADEELARQLAAEDERHQQQQQRGRMSNTNSRGVNQSEAEGGGGMGLASALGRFADPVGRGRPAAPSRAPASRRTQKPRPPAGTKGRGVHIELPADFLRIPGNKYPTFSASPGSSHPNASSSGNGAMGQLMTDEQLARMLQDELFQEELRINPEFSHLAGRRNPRASAGGISARPGGQTMGRSTYGGAGGGVGWGERTDFLDRLSELGDNAKRRFQEFAAGWNNPNARPNWQSRPLFGGGGAHSSTNEGGERTGLLSNDLNMDEEEMNFIGGGDGGGKDFEMNHVGSSDKKKD